MAKQKRLTHPKFSTETNTYNQPNGIDFASAYRILFQAHLRKELKSANEDVSQYKELETIGTYSAEEIESLGIKAEDLQISVDQVKRSLEIQNQATETRLRHERKLGELLERI